MSVGMEGSGTSTHGCVLRLVLMGSNDHIRVGIEGFIEGSK